MTTCVLRHGVLAAIPVALVLAMTATASAQSRTYGAQETLRSFPSTSVNPTVRGDRQLRDATQWQLRNDIRRQSVRRQNQQNNAASRSQPVPPKSSRSSVVVNQ